MAAHLAAIDSGRARFAARRLGAIEDAATCEWGSLFISPWLFGFIVLGIFPILYTFYLSLTRYSGHQGPPVFIGIQNYQRMAADPLFLEGRLQHALLHVAGGPDRRRRGDGPGARR